jgi:hypothetical protein
MRQHHQHANPEPPKMLVLNKDKLSNMANLVTWQTWHNLLALIIPRP